jgi:hypothetical protein
MRWRFSHLNQRRRIGFAGGLPAQGVVEREAGVRGVEARRVRWVEVRMGVWWM